MPARLSATRSRFHIIRALAFMAWACAPAIAGTNGGEMAATNGSLPELKFDSSDRVLVLAPHPDDETIGCGAVLQAAQAQGLPSRVVFLTYGDNNEWSFAVYRKHIVLKPSEVRGMGEVRHDEAVSATGRLGLPASSLLFLGYPDFRTIRLWTDHWADRPPLEGMLTRATSVPYTNAYRFGAPYRGDSVLADLEAILREFRPTRVFLSHPADFNPDHRALYLFTRVALWDLARQGLPPPVLHPYLVHFPRWPRPRAEDPALPLLPPPELAQWAEWTVFPVAPDLRAAKRDALRCHRSQMLYSAHYLGSFLRANELFGDLPALELSRSAAGRSAVRGAAGQTEAEPASDERLTEEDRSWFVGIEWRHMLADTNGLTLSIELSRPLGDAVAASVNVCGYRNDVPFARMPKLHVAVGALGTRVDDNGVILERDGGVKVSRRPRELEVMVPWAALRSPQRLLVSARTYLGDIPLDSAAWRVVELTP